MKAFTSYPEKERNLRLLMDKLKNYGYFNCHFETFCLIYYQWHLETFPGTHISTNTALFREDWFESLLKYLSEFNLLEGEVIINERPSVFSLLRECFKRRRS